MSSDALNAWLQRLELRHPIVIDLGLDRIAQVFVRLALGSLPTVITIAGTNGKGSVVACTEAGLRAAGARVGVYTSPHLIDFNERIVIDGAPACDADIVAAFEAIERCRGEISLSYFEFTTLAALWLFSRAGLDYWVMEVGLGGRLDAVNILDADIAVITSIGIDHTEYLGETREQIAPEKCGIARAGKPCVVAEADPPASLAETLDRIGAKTIAMNAAWSVSDTHVRLADGRSVPLPAVAGLLPRNVGAALQVLALCGVDPAQAAVHHAVAAVRLPGRCDQRRVFGYETLYDVAHNCESVALLRDYLTAHPVAGRTIAVFAAMADKPIHAMLSLIADLVDAWWCPALPDNPRAAQPSDVCAMLPRAVAMPSADVPAALQAARESMREDDRLLVFGSFFTVGAALKTDGGLSAPAHAAVGATDTGRRA
jgi:dihydrofolate synthase/folylpolyglutamate synthase